MTFISVSFPHQERGGDMKVSSDRSSDLMIVLRLN